MAVDLRLEQFLDNETGEVYFPTDAETGEPEVVEGRRFRVPASHQQPQQEPRRRRLTTRKNPVRECCFRQQEIQTNVVKEMIVCTRRNVGPIVFMLPTLLICPAWASILCLLGEACMHIWSHKRNRKKKNADVEYRSPFHLISSQFCIHCRSQRLMEKIREIQDKRTLRRRIIYPNFLRKMMR